MPSTDAEKEEKLRLKVQSELKSKLRKTKATEDSIAKTTEYIIKYRKCYETIIETWLNCIRKAKPSEKHGLSVSIDQPKAIHNFS